MNTLRFAAVLAGSAVLFSSSALAGPATNKKTFHLPETVTVEGKKLAPGDYKVEWTEPGTDVQVTILEGKTAVTTLSAHVIPVNVTILKDGYSTTTGQDGSKALTQLLFSGKKYQLQIQPAGAAVGAQASDAGRPN
jgi:hypothetical protein